VKSFILSTFFGHLKDDIFIRRYGLQRLLNASEREKRHLMKLKDRTHAALFLQTNRRKHICIRKRFCSKTNRVWCSL